MALAANPGKVYLKTTNVTPSGSDEVKGINKAALKVNGEQLDVTDFKDTSAFRLFLQGLKNWSMEISGFFEPTDTPQGLILTNLLTPGNLFAWIEMNPSGSTGAKGLTGAVSVESYNLEGEVGGVVGFSATLRGTGALAVDA